MDAPQIAEDSYHLAWIVVNEPSPLTLLNQRWYQVAALTRFQVNVGLPVVMFPEGETVVAIPGAAGSLKLIPSLQGP